MKDVPEVREDGRCFVCLGPRVVIPKTLVKRSAHDLRMELERDPFCGTNCARSYYGTSLPAVSTGNRTPRPIAPIMHGTETGYSRGCHCPDCRKAASQARYLRTKRQTA